MMKPLFSFLIRVRSGLMRRLRYLFYSRLLGGLGCRTQICENVTFINYSNIRIGSGVTLNRGVLLQSCQGASIHIEDDVVLSYDALILTGGRKMIDSGITSDHEVAPVFIGKGAWIGARAVLLPGVNIGASSVVAAGSIVTKNVEGGWLVAGVPAKPVKKLITE